MSAILIRTDSRENENFILKLAKGLRLRTKVLSEDEENDMLLINSIDEGMKSGEASREKVQKLFKRHGLKI